MTQPAAQIGDHRAGMTLIEVLITLAIVAVLSTLVVLGLGLGGRGADPRTEANRLAEQLGVAADEVLVTRRPIALSWDDKGYRFVGQDDAGQWTKNDGSSLGSRHDLPRGLSLDGDGPALLVIAGDAASSQVRLSIADGRKAWTVDFDGLNPVTHAGLT